MDGVTQSALPISLVIELGSGVAVIDGERIELPSKELRLLAELAARPGQAVSSKELIAAVWPEAPWMSPQDLYWHISQLRRDLGGSTGARKMIRNRRGFGYFLELPREAVTVVESSSTTEHHPEGAQVDEDDTMIPTLVSTSEENGSQSTNYLSLTRVRQLLPASPVLAAILVLGLIAASWLAGFLLSTRPADDAAEQRSGAIPELQAEPPQPPPQVASEKSHDKQSDSQNNNEKNKKNRSRRRDGRGTNDRDRTLAAFAPATEPEVAPPSSAEPNNTLTPDDHGGSTSTEAHKQAPAQPTPPPAPTRYLYHLVSEETGDHFVTTDGSVASEHEAKGYKGGAIARVYTSPEDDTKAITTNRGEAYVFINSDAETEPASETTPLWYSTNDDGDFFYTTSKAEASQDGWSATLIGYVRTLS